MMSVAVRFAFLRYSFTLLISVGVFFGTVQIAYAHVLDDVVLTTAEGDPFALRSFKGRTFLVMNVGLECGFTGNYFMLEQYWLKYRERGLVVFIIPTFDYQENPSAYLPYKFCQGNYTVSYPVMAPTYITGSEAHPFFAWILEQDHTSLPKDNYYLYLINYEGKLVKWFNPSRDFLTKAMIEEVEKNLPPTYMLPSSTFNE